MKKKVNKSEISILKEKFLISFCKKRGWNYNELTTGQMLIIMVTTMKKNYNIDQLIGRF